MRVADHQTFRQCSNSFSNVAWIAVLFLACGSKTQTFGVSADEEDASDTVQVIDVEPTDAPIDSFDLVGQTDDVQLEPNDSGPEADHGMDVVVDAARDVALELDAQNDVTEEVDVSDITPCSVGGVPGQCLHVDECDGDRHSTPGFCPGPAEIQCCTPDTTNPECDPDEQPLPNLDFDEPAGVGGCPDGMVAVDTFCVDRYEAILVEVTDDGSWLPWSPYFNPGDRTMRALSVPATVPQGYINREQAAAACQAASKRLCSRDEWLRACQGPPPGQSFPYGDEREWGRCNDNRSQHPAVEYFGTTADWIFSHIDHPCLNQLPDSLALTGENAECLSNEGAYDLVGNLHEWTDETTPEGHGVFRGGFYVDTVVNGEGCAYRTTAHWPTHWDYSTGFRCCADPL